MKLHKNTFDNLIVSHSNGNRRRQAMDVIDLPKPINQLNDTEVINELNHYYLKHPSTSMMDIKSISGCSLSFDISPRELLSLYRALESD